MGVGCYFNVPRLLPPIAATFRHVYLMTFRSLACSCPLSLMTFSLSFSHRYVFNITPLHVPLRATTFIVAVFVIASLILSTFILGSSKDGQRRHFQELSAFTTLLHQQQ